MRDIFIGSLRLIGQLMEDQIDLAVRKQIVVDKVVLVGGFGDSPALKEYLKSTLDRLRDKHRIPISMVVTPPNTGAAGVATGALIRALDKEHGPSRVPRQSIGVIQHLPLDQNLYSNEVLNQTSWEENPLDNEWYIKNTLRWIIKVVSPLS